MDKGNKVISIVIPLFNKGNHIQRAITSVLNQTYRDFELIIINDGSTDNSFDVVNDFVDKRIRILTQPNQGVSNARNRGVAEAKYDWVAFLDADDEWLPDFLQRIKNLHADFPTAKVLATGYFIDDGKSVIAAKNTVPFPFTSQGIIEDYFMSSLQSLPFCASSVVVEKESLINAGLFPEGITVTEDSDTWCRLALKFSIAYQNLPGAVYHQEAENRYTANPSRSELFVVTQCKKYLATAPADIQPSIYEFIVRHEIARARTLLLSNQKAEVGEILHYCSKSLWFIELWKKTNRFYQLPSVIRILLLKIFRVSKFVVYTFNRQFGINDY